MKYKIINGDSTIELKNIPTESIDTIVFSPPYNKKGLRNGRRTSNNIWHNANVDYATYEDNMPEDEYQQWQIDIMNECYRIVKPTGSIFYQHKIRNWDRKGSHPMSWLSKTDCQFYQEIVWNRKITMAMDENYLFNTTERIYWFCKDRPYVFKSKLPEEFKKDIWTIIPEKQINHPAPFPVIIPKMCILLTTPEDGVVLDPFNGSGSTGMAAVELGHTYVGIEIDEKYVDISVERIDQHLNRIKNTDLFEGL